MAHVVIDGGIKSARRAEPPDKPDSLLDPDAIAASYLHVIHQPRSVWATEIELRRPGWGNVSEPTPQSQR